MPEGTLILAYQLGEPDSLLLAIEAQGVSAHLLPSRHVLAPLVHELLAHLRAPERFVALPGTPAPDASRSVDHASRLAELLLEPVARKLGAARHVVIVPDRALHRLPFEVLPLPREGAPLGLARPLSYLATPSFFALRPRRAIERVVLLKALEGAPLEGLPPLLHGRAEAVAVSASYGQADVALIEAAERSVDETLAALSRPADVLHVIAHARLSGLEGPQIVLRTGRRLDARAIASTSLDVDLVVLSACESGGGEILGGEGVLGLVRAFRTRGTEAIVASLWPVDDASTAALMGHFHAELAAGRSPSEALLSARRALVSEAGVEHPYFWAPFVVYGSR
jgi:CHAT domain-containing protein